MISSPDRYSHAHVPAFMSGPGSVLPGPREDAGGAVAEPPRLSGSLLAIKDLPFDRLQSQCFAALAAGIDLVHFDVLTRSGKSAVVEEGSMATSSELTPALLARLREGALVNGLQLQADVHVLDEHPTREQLWTWIDAGVAFITIHWEAFRDQAEFLGIARFLKKAGVRVGVAIRPDVDLQPLCDFLKAHESQIDLVSQMGVMPGAGGQAFRFSILDNVRALNDLRRSWSMPLQIMVDGGVEPNRTSALCLHAGADILVAGSAIFGDGWRDPVTMRAALEALKSRVSPVNGDLYDVLVDRILGLRSATTRRLWIRIEGFHAAGKTAFTNRLCERLAAARVTPVVLPLDLSWTDRTKRQAWAVEAARARANGTDHQYFHALEQAPEPMHWRRAHADAMVARLDNCSEATVTLDNCYSFATGSTNDRVTLPLASDSIVLVEGVYASALAKRDWDLTLYLDGCRDAARSRAMVRDSVKVMRPPEQTRALYDQVYLPTYDEYLGAHDPAARADVVVAQDLTHHTVPAATPALSLARTREPIHVLRCSNRACGRIMPHTRAQICIDCGSDLMTEVLGQVNFLGEVDEACTSMWRFRNLLPIQSDTIVTAGEGATPIRYLDDISCRLGVNVWAKLETENPTGTFKDREASYIVSRSKQFGQRNIVLQSTGNTAVAVTHYAGLAGIPSWAFIPSRSVYKLLMSPKRWCNRIIAVDGHPIDVKAAAEDFALCFNYPKVSPFHERCDANKTMGYEVAEALLRGDVDERQRLGDRGIEFYVQTLSAGMGLIGFHQGMRDVERWTMAKVRAPRMVAVEISEFAPIHAAWEAGVSSVGPEAATPLFPNHELFEPTLWTTNIGSYYSHLRRMLIESRGILSKVTPSQVCETLERFELPKCLRACGRAMSSTEQSSYIGFAGLVDQVSKGAIPQGANVLVMVTGKGLWPDFVLETADCVIDRRRHAPVDVLRIS